MRKLLLASVAVFSAGVGVVETAQAQDFPNPGQVTVRLNGRFRFYASINNQSNANNNVQGSNDGVTPLTGYNKLANYEFTNYGRLYPGFDGVTANGLKYGASMEIRSTIGSGAGYGIYGGTGQQVAARDALYLYKDWGYIGTDKLGTVRFGQTDNVTSLYITGTYENFNDGGFDGDLIGTLPGNLIPAWPFLDSGALTIESRAVYLSPQIFGFDFGVSYAPSTGTGNDNSNCGTGGPLGTNFVNPGGPVQGTIPGTIGSAGAGTVISSVNGTVNSASSIGAFGANGQSIAGPGCDALSATPTADNSRPRNIWDGLLRYRGSFGDFGIAATAGYLGSGTVAGNAAPSVGQTKYDGLSVGDFGLAVTYGGLSVGGHYTFGKMNGGGQGLIPRNSPQMSAWLVGASYTIGPIIAGASYFVDDSVGNATASALGNQLHEIGLTVGGTYSIAPGLALFLSYMYGERRQNGFNFITGTNITNGTRGTPQDYTLHNKVTSQVIGTGLSFAW